MASIKRRAAKGDIEVGSERDLIVLFSSESDTESIVGSPQKQRPWPTLTSRSGDRKCVRTESAGFEVKTLAQIRQEKFQVLAEPDSVTSSVPEEERGDHDPERLQEQRLLQRILGESPVYDDLPSVVSSDTCSLRVTNVDVSDLREKLLRKRRSDPDDKDDLQIKHERTSPPTPTENFRSSEKRIRLKRPNFSGRPLPPSRDTKEAKDSVCSVLRPSEWNQSPGEAETIMEQETAVSSSTPDANVFVGDSGSLKDFLGLDLAEEVNDLNKDATDLMTEMEDFLR